MRDFIKTILEENRIVIAVLKFITFLLIKQLNM